MVRKLIKHELIALFRMALIPAVMAILISIIYRVALTTNNLELIEFMDTIYTLDVVVMLVGAFVVSVTQFSKSMFTSEGYMTFSLPVSSDEILFSKMISALIVEFFGIVVFAVTFGILSIARDPVYYESLGEFFDFGVFQLVMFLCGPVDGPFVIAELILIGLALLPQGLLFAYLSISIGQLLTNKGRKTVSVLIWMGVNFVLDILVLVFLVPTLEVAVNIESVHFFFVITFLVVAGTDVGMYFLVRYIMRHRVNLIV